MNGRWHSKRGTVSWNGSAAISYNKANKRKHTQKGVFFFCRRSRGGDELTSDFAVAKHVVDAHTQINLLLSPSPSR